MKKCRVRRAVKIRGQDMFLRRGVMPVGVAQRVVARGLRQLPLDARDRLRARVRDGYRVEIGGPLVSANGEYGDPFVEALPGVARRLVLRFTAASGIPIGTLMLELCWLDEASMHVNTNPEVPVRWGGKTRKVLWADALSQLSTEQFKMAVKYASQTA